MPKRRDRPIWWKAGRSDRGRSSGLDVRQFDCQPLDFSHRAYLTALGLAREVGEDDVLELDAHGLATYERPAAATDDLVMQVVTREGDSGPYTIMAAVPSATRLDPVAAQWLWTAMKEGLLGGTLSVLPRSELEEARLHVARWIGFESQEARRLPAV